MKTNNPSDMNKMKNQSAEQDVNENVNKKNKMNQSDSNSNMNKGTGMSSEAGSNQSEKSWQGTGGSMAGSGSENMGKSSQNSKGNSNMSASLGSANMSNSGMSHGMSGDKASTNGGLNTDYVKNQSDQQRRSSMGDGTPEKDEKNLKDTPIGDEELNDVDWNTNKNNK